MSKTVEDVMAPATIVIGPNETVARARRIMKLENVHALPVVDAYNAVLGLVTSTDLLMDHSPRKRVSRIMSHGLVTITPRAGVPLAARLMRRNRIHHLVVTRAGRVVGIVSAFDLLMLLDRPPSRRKKRKTTRRK